MRPPSSNFTTAILISIILASTVTLGYTRYLRFAMIPADIGYIPPEANIIMATGALGSIWDGVDYHFGNILKDNDRESGLGNILNCVGAYFKAHHIPVESKDELEGKYGLDAGRGTAFALSVIGGFEPGSCQESENDEDLEFIPPELEDSKYIWLLPVSQSKTSTENDRSSQAKLIRFLTALMDSGATSPSAEGHPVPLSFEDHPDEYCHSELFRNAVFLQDHILIFPEDDIALLGNSCAMLSNSVNNHARNLADARRDDRLFEASRKQLQRPLLSGSGVLVYLRGLTLDFSPVVKSALTLNFTPESVLVMLRAEADEASIKVIDHLLAPPPAATMRWRRLVTADSSAVFLARDKAISAYLDLLAYSVEFSEFLKGFLGGILEQTRQSGHLDQAVLAVTGYRDGVPLLLLGLGSDSDELSEQLLQAQKSLRNDRDRAVLEGMQALWNENEKTRETPLESVDSLLGAYCLVTGADAACESDANWFKWFRLDDGLLENTITPDQDLPGSDYAYPYGGQLVRYLEPRITENDLKYRIKLGDNLKGKEVLLENRYRLSSVLLNETLWIATGNKQIETLIDRHNGAGELEEFSIKGRSRNDKISVFLNTDSLIESGLLSGQQGLLEKTEKWLLDFRDHPEIVITLKPLNPGQALEISIEARRPEKKNGG